MKPEDWKEGIDTVSRKVPARPVRTSLKDPVNQHSKVLKMLLDELVEKVKRKLERVRSGKKIKFLGVKNSTEFLEKIKDVKVTGRSLLVTSDFSDAYTSTIHSEFSPAIRKLSKYCDWCIRKENLSVKLTDFIVSNCYMKLPTKIVRQDRG